jgi:UDP:flavonoid glycosyltransferase YjiC (YdhE family)
LGAAGSRAPILGWWADLDETQPVVNVIQGTIANIDYGQAIAPTLRALAEEDVLVVVTTGRRLGGPPRRPRSR